MGTVEQSDGSLRKKVNQSRQICLGRPRLEAQKFRLLLGKQGGNRLPLYIVQPALQLGAKVLDVELSDEYPLVPGH